MSNQNYADQKDLMQSDNFWEFSLALYANPKIEEICLYLQNYKRFNVNILLFACWLASSGRGSLCLKDYELLYKSVNRWQSIIIQPLRQLRNLIKSRTRSLFWHQIRKELRAEELLAERMEQKMLLQTISRNPTEQMTENENIKTLQKSIKQYVEYLELNLTQQDEYYITSLFQILFPSNKFVKLEN